MFLPVFFCSLNSVFMPPKREVSLLSWLEAILARWDEYLTRLGRMFEFLVKVQDSQTRILQRVDEIENRLSVAPHSNGSTTEFYSALINFQSDAKTVAEKAKNVAWIGIGEQLDAAATAAFDRGALK